MNQHIVAASAALLFAACQSNAPAETAEAAPDARQGAEVQQVCFNSQIRNWRMADRDSVIIEKGVRDEYRLELIGTCEPNNAFTTIGLISRGGGSCLSRGDTLVTDERSIGGSCSIRRIHEWNKDALKAAAPAAS
ncbi:MAG: DUF6491 family protein [Alphaproteobacteria bacterium]|nr:DUF6491 family protein [Alphaproteobacteria bacterium]